MITRTGYTIVFLLTSLLLTLAAGAQLKTTVSVQADRRNILIGEPIKLKLDVEVPENEPIRFFQVDSLPHFEFLAKEKIDTINTGTGTRLTQVLHITSFDSGHWVIPPLVLIEGLSADSIPIDVGFSKFDPQQAYHDVKEIIEVKPEKKNERPWWWWWAIGGGTVLLLLILYFVFRKKMEPVILLPPQPIDPFKEAMAALSRLRSDRPDVKTYYSGIVDTFRIYVAQKKGIMSLQQTSDDLVVQLKSIDLPKTAFEQLAQSLRLSDFVKFAKYVPTAADDDEIFRVIKSTIEFIEQGK